MMGIIGRKMGMTQIFDSAGNCIPVTVIQAGPCQVTQVKTRSSRDGYNAVQMGFEKLPEGKINRPRKGHLDKAGVEPMRLLREFRVTEEEVGEYAPGQELRAAMFKPGDFVDISGQSKGRGFSGVMRRHNFHGARATHGTHEYFRHGGSIGCCTPQHTIRGTKMPGRHGGKRTTTQNLQVVDVRDGQNLILVRGAVPGGRNSLVLVRKSFKKKPAQ